MPGRKAKSLAQLIRGYGIDRVLDLAARGVSGKSLENRIGQAYPAATPSVIRQLIETARESRAAARLNPRTGAQLKAQRERAPRNTRQPRQFQYYTRTDVTLGSEGRSPTWNIRIDSSRQLTHGEIRELIEERVNEWRLKAIGESRERIRNSITVDEFRVIALTKKNP